MILSTEEQQIRIYLTDPLLIMHHWTALSLCFWTFPFLPVPHPAAIFPFLEPSSAYVTALLLSNVISNPTSNQFKSSRLCWHSWGYTPWTQFLSMEWGSLNSGCACFTTRYSLPQSPLPQWKLFLFPDSFQEVSCRVSGLGVSSLHTVHPWMLGFLNATSCNSSSAGCHGFVTFNMWSGLQAVGAALSSSPWHPHQAFPRRCMQLQD